MHIYIYIHTLPPYTTPHAPPGLHGAAAGRGRPVGPLWPPCAYQHHKTIIHVYNNKPITKLQRNRQTYQ